MGSGSGRAPVSEYDEMQELEAARERNDLDVSDLLEMSVTELRAVGPWVEHRIHEWLDDPPRPIEPEAKRGGFLTYAQVRHVLDARPEWEVTPHGDLQVHSTDSDGALPLAEMASVARALGRTFIASTDHSKS